MTHIGFSEDKIQGLSLTYSEVKILANVGFKERQKTKVRWEREEVREADSRYNVMLRHGKGEMMVKSRKTVSRLQTGTTMTRGCKTGGPLPIGSFVKKR